MHLVNSKVSRSGSSQCNKEVRKIYFNLKFQIEQGLFWCTIKAMQILYIMLKNQEPLKQKKL